MLHINIEDYKSIKNIENSICKNKLSDKVIFITGATGFLGFYLVHILMMLNKKLSLNNRVIVYVRNLKKAITLFDYYYNEKNFKILEGDITDKILIKDNIDYVIHAAMVSAKLSNENVCRVYEDAIIGSKNIISLALEKKVKSIVYMSSIAVYGDIERKKLINEEYSNRQNWRNDKDAYALGKQGAEFLLLAEKRKNNLPIKILRPGYVFGANPTHDDRVYNSIIECAAKKENIILYSNGMLSRSIVYVIDVVKAVLLALISDENEDYNVSGKNISLKEFADMVAEIANVNVLYNKKYNNYIKINNKNNISSSKIKKKLGWEESGTTQQLIKESLEIKRYFNNIVV